MVVHAVLTPEPRMGRLTTHVLDTSAGLPGRGIAVLLTRLDGAQNALFTTDFRQLYSTVARDWWGVSAEAVTRGRFEPVKFLRT